MTRRTVPHAIVAACVLALAVVALACNGDGDSGSRDADNQTPTVGASPPLALAEWAQSVCVISGVAAGALDVPGTEDPETLTLEERRQRAAEVLAPRAEALAAAAESIAELEAPPPAADFHQALHTTMADVAAAWQDLVDVAETAESADELNAANDVFIEAQTEADAAVLAAYNALDDETAVALSEPGDCGILNEIRS